MKNELGVTIMTQRIPKSLHKSIFFGSIDSTTIPASFYVELKPD